MELNRVTIEDYESIIAFYDNVTDRTPDMEQYARWKKGLHPTHDGIRASSISMLRSVIIYGSQYGTTKRYAERYSKSSKMPEEKQK